MFSKYLQPRCYSTLITIQEAEKVWLFPLTDELVMALRSSYSLPASQVHGEVPTTEPGPTVKVKLSSSPSLLEGVKFI